MNKSDISLFKCLCLDLDTPFLHNNVDLQVLSELRDRLLVLAEELFSNKENVDRWKSDFGLQFGFSKSADIANPTVFRDVYQVLSFLLKIPTPLTNELQNKYIEGFQRNEEDNKAWKVDRNCDLSRLARYLIRRSCASLDLSAENIAGRCRHGPGAVFDREVGSDKDVFSAPPSDLALSYGWEVFLANPSFQAEIAGDRSSALHYPRKRHVEARLALVPKTFKTVRGVFISPKEAMFCQLGQADALIRCMSKGWIGRCYNPSSQAPSQELAYMGSYDRRYATLDLSDASDRIPLSLIAYLFHRTDYVRLARTRPSYVTMPDLSRHRLAMYAPMGDGLTFPMLTLVCCTLVMAAMLHHDGVVAARPPTEEVLRKYASSFRVFGDDIIIESRYYDAVVSCLQIHNLKVNVRKSFSKGYFRESCGCDAYCGTDVTPLKLRCSLDPKEDVYKLIAFHNLLKVRRGTVLTRTIAYLSFYIQTHYRNIGLTSRPEMCPTCLYTDRSTIFKEEIPCGQYNISVPYEGRWNPDLMVWEQRCLVPVQPCRLLEGDPWWGLNAYLLGKRPTDGESIGSLYATLAFNKLASTIGMRTMRINRRRVAYGWALLV